jgi:hypothetical protein
LKFYGENVEKNGKTQALEPIEKGKNPPSPRGAPPQRPDLQQMKNAVSAKKTALGKFSPDD